MDVDTNSISSSVSFAASIKPQRPDQQGGALDRTGSARDVDEGHHRLRHRGHRHGHHESRGLRALDVLRQEIRVSISSRVAASPVAAYADAADDNSADATVNEVLTAAGRVVREDPENSSSALIRFRQRVDVAVAVSREVAGSDAAAAEVDDVAAQVGEGLDALQQVADRNVTSSASVLAVDTQVRERSTIKIRTQEGDIVKLDLRNVRSLSAGDAAVVDEFGSASVTTVELSERTRLSLKVDGDLNEAELQAIQNVFEQAEQIANEFFGGDIAAAFDLAAGFQYDSDQLARVKLGFSSVERTRVQYAEYAETAPASVPAPEAADEPSAAPVTAPVSDTEVAAPANEVDAIPVAETEEPVAAAPEPVGDSVLSDFGAMLGDFLRALNEGFESANGGFRLHFSQSFKLEILKSVLEVSAPAGQEVAADEAASVIDQVVADDPAQLA